MTLGKRLLLFTAAPAVLIVLALTAAAFLAFYDLNCDRIVADLRHNVANAAVTHGDIFVDTEQVSRRASEALARRLAAFDPDVDVDAEFDRIFPRQKDGTRRSRPLSFDGERVGSHGYTYGMGAFISGSTPLDRDRKILFLSVYDVVSQFGQALTGGLDNFYFFTTDNALIIFAPTRADRLDFYRLTAPPDFDFSTAQPTITASTSPRARTGVVCTTLENVIYDKDGEKISSGCLSAFMRDGKYQGAWGTTLMLNGWMERAIRSVDGMPSAFVIDQNGGIVAHEDIQLAGARRKTNDEVAAEIGSKALADRIAAEKSSSGVFLYKPWDAWIAYATFKGPDWRYVVSVPAASVQERALSASLAAALLGFVAVAALGFLLAHASERLVSRPLRALAAQADGSERFGAAFDADMASRDDEIGTLGRSFAARDARLVELAATLERRVALRTRELDEQRALAEAANRSKSEFLAKMSHEIRTPMNGVLGMAAALAQTELSSPQRRMLKVVTDSGDGLMTVLGEILDISKIEAGRLEIERAPFDLAAVLSAAASLNALKAEEKGLAFRLVGAPDPGTFVTGDAARLQQILNNLLSNAVKFTDAGIVEMRVTLADEGGRLAASIDVVDTGPGIAPETAARLFTPFVQADASTTRRYGGSGLGLAIARALAELMGGSLTLTSAPGQGSTFNLRKTFDRAAAPAPGESLPAAPARALTILAVDDNEVNRLVLKALLDSGPHEAVIVESGAAAVAAASRRGFDLVLMDIQMPDMDGIEAARRIRAVEAAQNRPPAPILALTANVMRHQVREYLASGLDGVLAKPLRAAELQEALKRWGGHRAAA